MQIEDGYLIVLPRAEAKAFFGHRQDDARLAYIHELLANDEIRRMNCGGKWQAIHDAFEGSTIDESVLGQAILGGRPLHQGDGHHVCLVRPDIVGFICEQAKQLDDDFGGEVSTEIKTAIETFNKAAEVGGAMVFVAAK